MGFDVGLKTEITTTITMDVNLDTTKSCVKLSNAKATVPPSIHNLYTIYNITGNAFIDLGSLFGHIDIPGVGGPIADALLGTTAIEDWVNDIYQSLETSIERGLNSALKGLPCIPIGPGASLASLVPAPCKPEPGAKQLFTKLIPTLNSALKGLADVPVTGATFAYDGPTCPAQLDACCLDGSQPGKASGDPPTCPSSCCGAGDIVTMKDQKGKWLTLGLGFAEMQYEFTASIKSVTGLNTLSVVDIDNICFTSGVVGDSQMKADVTINFSGFGAIADIVGTFPTLVPQFVVKSGKIIAKATATNAKALLKGELTFTAQGNLAPSDSCTGDDKKPNITLLTTDKSKIKSLNLVSLDSNLKITGLEALKSLGVDEAVIAEKINQYLSTAGAESLIEKAFPVIEPLVIPVLLPVIQKALGTVCVPFG